MRKKSLLTVWLLLCLFSTGAIADLEQSRDAIITHIKSGQFESAKSGIDKLIADNPQSPDLPEAIFSIAEEYGYAGKREDEKNFYKMIISNYPDNSIAGKAKLGIASAEVRNFIVSQDYDLAKENINKMIIDFNDRPDLPGVLCRLACGFEWSERYLEAKEVFQQIIDKYADSNIADKAKLGFYRNEICSIINSSMPNMAEKGIIEKIKEDFANSPDLEETLYRIARRYEWSDRYTEANDLFRRIIQNYPKSPLAEKAQLGLRRSEIRFLIASIIPKKRGLPRDPNAINISAENLAKAQESITNLIIEFNGNPALPDALYYIAQRYGYSGRFEEEKALYRRIIDDFPKNSLADKAKLDLAGTEILDLVLLQNANDSNTLDMAIEKFVADFNENPYFLKAMLFMADKCHEYGVRLDTRREIVGSPTVSRPFSFAANLLEKYILGKVEGIDNKADEYRIICENYYRLGNGQKSAEYAELTLQIDPQHRYAANMLWLAATGYERMKAAKEIPVDDADSIIEGTYQELMDKFPQNHIAEWAALHLGQVYIKEGKNFKACAYFGWFLMNASPETMQDKMRMAAIRNITEGCGRYQGGNSNGK